MSGGYVTEALVHPLGYAQATSIDTAKTLAGAGVTIPSGTRYALLQADTQNVRWRDDGTAPTAAVGMLLTADDVPFFYSATGLHLMQIISAVAGAKLNLSFYGE